MGYRFCDFIKLLKDACFPSVPLELFVENALSAGIDDEEGQWIFPEVSPSVSRDYISGRKLIPQNKAKDIRNHFINSGVFIDTYDNLLEIEGTRNRILEGLESRGIEGLNPNNLSRKLFELLIIFLSAFEYGTDRISTGLPRSELETDLLNEVNYRCPKCGENLVIKLTDSHMAEYYDVYDIFPEGELMIALPSGENIIPPVKKDPSDNKIVLCKKHHKKMSRLSPSDSYLFLSPLKEKIVFASSPLAKSEALEIIAKVLRVITIPQNVCRRKLRINPLVLKRKLGGMENHLLYEQVFLESDNYYKPIKEMLSELDDSPKKIWNKFASYISAFYEENANLDHYAIYAAVTERILELSTQEKTAKNKMACGYITSFFIQNCEVFDEIPE